MSRPDAHRNGDVHILFPHFRAEIMRNDFTLLENDKSRWYFGINLDKVDNEINTTKGKSEALMNERRPIAKIRILFNQ